ncbi:hypothetical protein FB567DRAFT_584640 [Paraphoma chrysanthemicola]|uniref:C2H2-type domain-containing protein n=1 Tax=Paraphoma chrysanthemicola TaxID=798071 RepID=A0A8K0QU13_9PLEO|nr:hypothetical protein FB567DRAFT_584640 [Paraphoma chrysanthemicola]
MALAITADRDTAMSELRVANARSGQLRTRRREKQPRKCLECGQLFSKAEHLSRHIRSHTKERPFQCDVCNKAYSRHNSLLRHARTHDGGGAARGGACGGGNDATFELGETHAMADFIGLSASTSKTPPYRGSLEHGLNSYEPAWLLGDDFDVDALNLSISARLDAVENTPNNLHTPSSSLSLELVSRVQQKWHIKLSRVVTPRHSTDQVDQGLVDESYRDNLSHRLHPRMSNISLPSADFLNLCIKLYFDRFNPVFPIIHGPTFRPSSENVLLLLSICSIGAPLKIFQILNKAILASWENYIRREGREALSLAQAAIIGQTFGMLSGQPQDLIMTESFHGTVIAWARQAGLFKIKNSPANLDTNTDVYLETTCDLEIMGAGRGVSTPRAWALFLYASLSGIVASIQEAKTSFVNHASVQNFRDVLLTWYKDNHKVVAQPKHSPISLMVLWHTAFMCLYANFDLSERAIGRDGGLSSEEAASEARAWVSSPEARYAVLHAFLVLKQLESLPVGVEPAIHVPKALFHSAIVTRCYTQLGRTANSFMPSHDETDMPEFLVAGSALSSQQSGSNLWPRSGSPIDKITLCSIIDLLRRTGHWEILQSLLVLSDPNSATRSKWAWYEITAAVNVGKDGDDFSLGVGVRHRGQALTGKNKSAPGL